MDLKQMRVFVALAEELHFQRAARRLNVTQPSLSYQIKGMEADLGVTLLARDRRSVALTQAGRALYEGAKAVLAQTDTLLREVKALGETAPQRLVIGTIDYLNLGLIARSVMRMRLDHPRIEVEQREIPTNQIFDAVKEREIDIGFAPLPATHPTLKVRRVTQGHWCLVLREDHPLTAAQDIPLSALEGLPLILFDKALNPKLHGWWLANFEKAGFAPRIVLETKQVQTALNMAAGGLALYIVASYIVTDLPAGLVARPLTGFDNAIAIGAVWHEANASAGLRQFLTLLRG